MRPCNVPPEGWRCTRTRGHEGPCAAVRVLLCFGLMVLTTPLWAAVAVLAVGYEAGLAAWYEGKDQVSEWASAMRGALKDAIT